ncbi:hypothetical protein GCM10007276_12410 [Agaricicola taiwanensis]|uniref:Formyl transferase N-terminal domain-containing protein n=1 Tax=Agaricicola taiwanensis TaxID=591372 RepID=A0A8J2VQ30_9RHOB|nr:formyltransferase family protein [Agaricicola taiwanensis]GGE36427.1 hypothetical protein GCM10007276_12410 [Agaricicola taiwanensis]
MVTVLSKPKHRAVIHAALPSAQLVEGIKDLTGGECLIAYGTGVIVPPDVLARYKRAYNLHGASPSFPGRDPHHWAAYEGATQFGATAHVMTALVDDGPIVGTLLEDVPAGATPDDYRAVGERTIAKLFADLAPAMARGELAPTGMQWGPIKRARSHMLAMFDFAGLPPDEVQRRRRAFKGFEAHFKTAQPAL